MFQVYSKVIHIYIHIHISDLFHYRLLQDTGYNSLCSTVDPCYLSILYVVVYICKPKVPIYRFPRFLHFPHGNHEFVFCLWVDFYVVNKFTCIIFLDFTYKWYNMITVFLKHDFFFNGGIFLFPFKTISSHNISIIKMISSYLVVLKQLSHEKKPPKSKEKYLEEKEDRRSACQYIIFWEMPFTDYFTIKGCLTK